MTNDALNTAAYDAEDRLVTSTGSTSIQVADSAGNIVARSGHYPYGESWYASSATTKWQFTRSTRYVRSGQASYERDVESGNDYALFRTHINCLGQFSSPAPIADGPGKPALLESPDVYPE